MAKTPALASYLCTGTLRNLGGKYLSCVFHLSYVQLPLVTCPTATSAVTLVPSQMYLDSHVNSSGCTWSGGTEHLPPSVLQPPVVPVIPHLLASLREQPSTPRLLCEPGTEMQENTNNTMHFFYICAVEAKLGLLPLLPLLFLSFSLPSAE